MMILTYVFIFMFLLCAVQVFRVASTSKRTDLYWMVGNFVAAAFGNLFTSVIQVPILGTLGLIVSSLCIVMFVQRSFYRDRKSPYLFVIGLLLVMGVVQIYLAITNPAGFLGMTQLGFVVVWGWQAVLAFQGQRGIGKDRTVEDWVKARYWFWFAYAFVMFLIAGRMLLPFPYAGFEFMITSPLVMLCVLMQYLTWAMPEFVRKFLNRKYQPAITASPAELMAMAEKELMLQAKAKS